MGNLWILLFIYSNETKQANSVPWWIIFQLQVIVHPIIKIRSSLLTLMFLLNLLSVVEHIQKKIFWGMFLANLFHTSKMKNYIYKVLIFQKKNHHWFSMNMHAVNFSLCSSKLLHGFRTLENSTRGKWTFIILHGAFLSFLEHHNPFHIHWIEKRSVNMPIYFLTNYFFKLTWIMYGGNVHVYVWVHVCCGRYFLCLWVFAADAEFTYD